MLKTGYYARLLILVAGCLALTGLGIAEAESHKANQTANFSFMVSDRDQYALQAYGSEIYTLTEGAGSPPISALKLPTANDDAAQYSVSFFVNGALSAPVTEAAGATVAAPSGATGVQVTLLDANGTQITSPGDFTFYLNFAANGSVAANVTGNEPPIGNTFTPTTLPTGGVRKKITTQREAQ